MPVKMCVCVHMFLFMDWLPLMLIIVGETHGDAALEPETRALITSTRY